MVIDCLKKKIMKKIIIITIVSLIVVGAAYLIFKKPNESENLSDESIPEKPTPEPITDISGGEVSVIEEDGLFTGTIDKGDPSGSDGENEFTFTGVSNNSNNRP